MNAIAPDNIWSQMSWSKTDKKESFPSALSSFWAAIKKISSETLPECNNTYCESRVKTFLRHTYERTKRSTKNNGDEP